MSEHDVTPRAEARAGLAGGTGGVPLPPEPGQEPGENGHEPGGEG